MVLLAQDKQCIPGDAGVFVDGAGLPLFQTQVEEYLKGVRTKLLEWSLRLIEQVAAIASLKGYFLCMVCKPRDQL